MIPQFNYEDPVVIQGTTGRWVESWLIWFGQLVDGLQAVISDAGIIIPQLSASEIVALDTIQTIGLLVYNSDANTLMVNLNGTFKTITTS